MAFNPDRKNVRLAPDVNRILYVRNLPYKITNEVRFFGAIVNAETLSNFLFHMKPSLTLFSTQEMYDLFGKYGGIRQIRIGNDNDTRGTAYVVYDDIFDAKNACEHLSGFNVVGRYLIVLYYNPTKLSGKKDFVGREQELNDLRKAASA